MLRSNFGDSLLQMINLRTLSTSSLQMTNDNANRGMIDTLFWDIMQGRIAS